MTKTDADVNDNLLQQPHAKCTNESCLNWWRVKRQHLLQATNQLTMMKKKTTWIWMITTVSYAYRSKQLQPVSQACISKLELYIYLFALNGDVIQSRRTSPHAHVWLWAHRCKKHLQVLASTTIVANISVSGIFSAGNNMSCQTAPEGRLGISDVFPPVWNLRAASLIFYISPLLFFCLVLLLFLSDPFLLLALSPDFFFPKPPFPER